MEYASSPVEQPGTQIRIGSLAILFSMILGRTVPPAPGTPPAPGRSRHVNQDVFDNAAGSAVVVKELQILSQALQFVQEHPAGIRRLMVLYL